MSSSTSAVISSRGRRNNSNEPTTLVCHSVPCWMKEHQAAGVSGPALVDTYFLPARLDSSSSSSSNNNNSANTASGAGDANTSKKEEAVYAATFRGRGLLGKIVSGTRNGSNNGDADGHQEPQGRVLEIPTSTTTSAPGTSSSRRLVVQTRAVWKDCYEWKHEHQPEQVLHLTMLSSSNNTNQKTNNGGSSNRWQRAREWMTVANALHAPIIIAPNGGGGSKTPAGDK